MFSFQLSTKIAVIGAGISGLTAAHYLSARNAVTLFEANNYIGGHTNTVDVELGDERHRIDTGFIVFNNRTYPNFVALLDELGVASRPTSMGFSLRCDRTGLEYNGSSLNGLFTQRRNLIRISFYRMLRDIVRFNRESLRLVLQGQWRGCDEKTTVAEFLEYGRYSREFVEHYLLPLGSAIWSCPVGTFAKFPIQFIVEFYRNHGMLALCDRPEWRVIQGGSGTYVAALIRRFSGRVFTSSPIHKVRRYLDRVEVTPRGGRPQSFDHVVIACHADQALKLLDNPSRCEKELLASFPYQKSHAVLHTDDSILPLNRRAWASWNYRLPGRGHLDPRWAYGPPQGSGDDACGTGGKGEAGATVTYCMNILQHLRSRYVFNVTLNSDDRIDPAKVLRRFDYEHPVFTARRASAQARHGELLDANRTSFCGAYWGNGFHEDGVVSALAVCQKLEGKIIASATWNAAKLQDAEIENAFALPSDCTGR